MQTTLVKKVVFLSLFLIASISGVFARKFYVSSSYTGSVSNGTLAAPWKSLANVQSNMGTFVAGDTISFKCGDVFTGQLSISKSGTATAPIVFNGYGTGAKPKFTGTGATITNLFYAYTRSYLVFDGLWITDPSLESDVARAQLSKIQRAIHLDASTYCTVRNCEMSLIGTGVYVPKGGYHLFENNLIYNLRMIVNTNDGSQPGNDDDYGANPITMNSSNNKVLNNTFYGAWAQSFDYTIDGGAIEMYDEGTGVSNNLIAYNTMYDCDGILEVKGVCNNNIVVYNRFINNGTFAYFHTSCTGWVIDNNIYIENTTPHRIGSYIFGGKSGFVTDLELKNNVFQLSTGITLANSSRFSPFDHTNNIYKLSNGTVTNFTLSTGEINTTTNYWQNTTNADPVNWDLRPIANSVLINTGVAIGQSFDFDNNAVSNPPEIGIYELQSGTAVAGITATATAGAISCYGGTTTVTVAATGGTAPYTGTGNFTVSAGAYNYIVTDANGARDTVSINVTQPSVISVTVASGTIANVGGTTSVQITATGGTGAAYSYSLNGGTYQSSNIFNGVPSGNHSVSVKDANGCIVVKSFFISAPVAPTLVVTSTAGTIACNGGSTTVVVGASGGTAPYTGTGSFTVNAGTYNYTVTDAAGVAQTTSIVVTQPSLLTISATAGTITAYGGTTSVTANGVGGTGTKTYKIDNGTYQSSNVFTTIAAGVHTVSVKDANGCTASVSITISQPAPLPLVVSATSGNILCNGNTTTVVVVANGGVAPYTGTGSFIVSAGTYNYSVTDALGTVANTSITITQPALINVTANAGTIVTTGGTTTITVTATGGTPAYSYKLDNGSYQGTNVFNGVVAGNHTVTVKDANGCIGTSTIVISQPSSLLSANVTSGTISCNGGTTIVTVSGAGGTAPYTGTGNFQVSAGTYTYTVTDANGVSQNSTITITQPAALLLSLNAGTIAVAGGITSVTATATGGTAPYTYTLDNASYQTSNVFNGVNAGAHSVLVKDAKGCTATSSVLISQPSSLLSANVTSGTISCYGGTTIVTVAAAGGTAPYTGTGNYQVSAGTYTYTVTDANGISQSSTITITQPSPVLVSLSAGTIAVAGGTTSITTTVTGGTAPFTYTLDNSSYQTSNVFNGVSTGVHSVLVKDANGCIGTGNITVAQSNVAPLVVTAVANSTITCFGGTTLVTVSATGGTAPYSGVGNFTAAAGVRNYTVIDASGQSRVATITITQPTDIIITVNIIGDVASLGGTTPVTIVATGGSGYYKYSLDGGPFQTSNSFRAVTAGNHYVTVMDANSCTKQEIFTVGQAETTGFQLALVAKTNASCRGGSDGKIEVMASGGRATYQYAIGTGAYGINNRFYNLRAGIYRVKAKDANGNVAELLVVIQDGRRRCPTGREAMALEVNTYPNPTTTGFSLSVAPVSDEDVLIEVMDMFGKKVYQEKGSADKVFKFGMNFKPGTYFIRISQGDIVETRKVIKM